MRQLTEIFEHTIDLSLIKRDSVVIDMGARDFGFANQMLQFVDKIYCVDADSDILNTVKDSRITFINAAVWPEGDIEVPFVKYGNGTGNYVWQLQKEHPKEHDLKAVKTITMEQILEIAGCELADVAKFDIEGSEVNVLLSLVKPPARQITVEMHMHTGTTMAKVQEVVRHLESLGYYTFKHELTKQHGLPVNFWDSLFLLRDKK